jgi:hypothetical protein
MLPLHREQLLPLQYHRQQLQVQLAILLLLQVCYELFEFLVKFTIFLFFF